jgi:LmbE family N-acetylglucosaminyl deacetylase
MTLVVVSTHFDDAVMSCWSLIDSGDDVTVLTVFTGGPEPGVLTAWDADSGVDSSTRMQQRREENRAALALAGRKPVDLGCLEGMYGGEGVDPDKLRPHLTGTDVVYIPAGVGVEHVNKEHVLVRDACLAVRGDCRLYADQPYCLFRDDTELPPELATGRDRLIAVLPADQRARKVEAIACYSGEVSKLEAAYGPLTEPDRLRHEVFWLGGGQEGPYREGPSRGSSTPQPLLSRAASGEGRHESEAGNPPRSTLTFAASEHKSGRSMRAGSPSQEISR